MCAGLWTAAGGSARNAKKVLAFLAKYLPTPLLEQAKLELVRARGVFGVAEAKLAAVERMNTQQADRAKASAEADYERNKDALVQQKSDEGQALQQTPSRKRGHKRGKAPTAQALLEVHTAKFTQLETELEDGREADRTRNTAANRAALLSLTGQMDSDQVERCLGVARGDVQLLTKLAPALREAGDEAHLLATELIASKDAETLVPRCRDLLANQQASPGTVVAVARFMIKVPAAATKAWALRNAGTIHARTEHMRFLEQHARSAATAVCALDELGLPEARALENCLYLGAPLEWCIVHLAGDERKAALSLISLKPAECEFVHRVLVRNPPAGPKHQSNQTLIAGINRYTGANYDGAHDHFVTTAACDLVRFGGILTKLAEGNTLQAATHWMAQTEIAVPEGVTVTEWQSLNDNGAQNAGGMIRYPKQFRKDGYRTDANLLKHADECSGPLQHAFNPATRLQNYFADLVAACDVTYAHYRTLFVADEGTVSHGSTPAGRGTWTIIIKKTARGPEIFHVDSGYERRSYWMTHDA